ncbi:MAG: cytochrome c3 family protein [Desulfobaccales bacterium]
MAGLVLAMLTLLGAHAGLIEPPAASLLKISGPAASRKPPVQFSHKLHEARRVGCTQCHHDYQGRRNVWHEGQPVQKCQACHGLTPKAGRLDAKNAFHRQCKGCHLRLKQQGRPAGPVECRGCHRSQSSRFKVQSPKFLTLNLS